MLAESLAGVISQNLIKSTDGGRVAALEILFSSSAISNLIREGKTFQIPGVMQTGRREGMQSMEQAVKTLMETGRISNQDALPFLTHSENGSS